MVFRLTRSSRTTEWSVAGALLLIVAACSDNSFVDSGCFSDQHCKGDRLCDIGTGTCFDPPVGMGGSSSSVTMPSSSRSSMASGGSGGSGGMPSSSMATGGASSSTGGMTGSVIETWSATAPQNDGSYTLPSWLSLSSPTSNRTSQTSATTLATGFGANVARARNTGADPSGWGLSIESQRTNQVSQSDSWTVGNSDWKPSNGMTVTTGQSDPANGNGATRFDSPASAAGWYSNYFQADARVASSWAKGVTAANPPYAHFRWREYHQDIQTTAWTRYRLSHRTVDGITNDPLNLETRDVPKGATAITQATTTDVYGAQLESALYPSSYIPTGSTSRTRFADILSANNASVIAQAGYFDGELVFAPRYASNDVDGGEHHDLLYFDAANRLFFRFTSDSQTPNNVDLTTAQLCLTVASDELCTPTISWSGEAELTIRASNTMQGRTLSISGIEANSSQVADSTVNPASVGNDVFLLGDQNGAQECGDLRSITFRVP